MYAPERYRSILERVTGKGRASVADLADDLDVTPETIRRDLNHLESRGLVRRVHGGAVPSSGVFLETTVASREGEQVAAKRGIAQAAAQLLPTTGAVIVDAGTTTGMVLSHLTDEHELTIITNSVEHALRLSNRPSITTVLVGGRLRSQTMACVDKFALDMLSGVFADVALIGTNGLSAQRGLTTPDAAEAAVKRAMLSSAGTRMVLADHTKFGEHHFAQFGTLDDFDLVITDVDGAHLDDLRRVGKQVVVA